MKRWLLVTAVLVSVLPWVGCSGSAPAPAAAPAAEAGAAASDDSMVPYFEADPSFPKPLPNNWAYGAVVGVAVDATDRVWIIHRPSMMTRERNAADGVSSYCCNPAPPIVVYDKDGNFVKAWGPIRNAPRGEAVGDVGTPGPAATRGGEIADPQWKDHWPESEHGIHVDYKGFVWTGGNGQKDSRVLKFDENGKFIMQIGNFQPYGIKGTGHDGGPDSSDLKNLNKPTTMAVDPATNELFVADGYGNRRLIVFDADTGQHKRHWGAYGNPPDDKDKYNATRGGTDKTYDPKIVSKQFGRATHGTALSKDGHVYVADRPNHRIQAFTFAGKYEGEVFTDRRARGTGAAGAVVVSHDQKWLYVTDSQNSWVWIIRRSDLKKVGHFGTSSGYPGGFFAVHDIDVDSKGNIYTGETLTGRRVQRFIYKGLRPAPKQDWVD